MTLLCVIIQLKAVRVELSQVLPQKKKKKKVKYNYLLLIITWLLLTFIPQTLLQYYPALIIKLQKQTRK